MRRLVLSALASAAFAATMFATPASATITITTNQGTDQGTIVLLPDNQTGATVQGFTQPNQGGFALNFSSTTDTLETQANGQAKIDATDGTINNLTISGANGGLFDFIEFNAFGAGSILTIQGYDQFGLDATFVFGDDPNENLNGENFFFAGTDELQAISSITITGAFDELRQVRVGPAVTIPGAVPEPGTWAMMLLGFGATGAALRRRRRTGKLIQQIA